MVLLGVVILNAKTAARPLATWECHSTQLVVAVILQRTWLVASHQPIGIPELWQDKSRVRLPYRMMCSPKPTAESSTTAEHRPGRGHHKEPLKQEATGKACPYMSELALKLFVPM